MAYRITDKCIGCTACTRVCPMEAITGERNAKHAIDPNLCVDCSACGRVCPVDAIANQYGVLQPHVKRQAWPKPVINAELCSGCSFCVDVCPQGCLALQPNPEFPGHTGRGSFGDTSVFVNPKTCVGCHFCEDVCAKNAIVMSDHLPGGGQVVA